jgi:amino acid transporter
MWRSAFRRGLVRSPQRYHLCNLTRCCSASLYYGCTAMTGVEAVSNGVQAFKEPVVDSARRTLTLIVGISILLLLGIAYLVSAYHITATDPGAPGYQSILSLVTKAIVGRGVFYYVTIWSILLSRGKLMIPATVHKLFLSCLFKAP